MTKGESLNKALLICGIDGCKAEYKDAAHLGIHRRAKHGILGRSHTSQKARALKAENEAKLANPEPAAVNGSGMRSKRKYMKRSTALANIDQAHPTNGNEHFSKTSYRPFHAEAALAVAYGRFKELCTSIAVEYDLPPRSFAARLAELIHAETLR